MMPLTLSAATLVTALGQGEAETFDSLRSGRSGLVTEASADLGGAYTVGRVAGLEAWRLPDAVARYQCRNNALAHMALSAPDFRNAVAQAVERYGAARIATLVGTSTSGIMAAEDAYRSRDPATGALPADFSYQNHYDLFSLSRLVREVLGLRGLVATISTACASSARCFLDAHALIAAGMADAAIVGGADSLCRLTLRGFNALELLSPGPCRPCDAGRDGISIGEAAGFVLLERYAPAPDGVALLGAGASSDGHHMSSPRPDGTGAMRAMRAALSAAGLQPADIDYINLHGTGTRANDAMEDQAVFSLFGGSTLCGSTKAYTGHTMGSCGVVEAIIAKICLQQGFLPRNFGLDEVDPGFRMNLLTADRDLAVRQVMSNSFGFGGINCSLIFGHV